MRTIAERMLSRINAEIKLLNYDNDITADDALHMVKFITPLYSQLRKLVSDYVFPTNEEEVHFFKEIKPNILDKYLYFSKVYSIEMKCPIGNNEIIKEYLNQELQQQIPPRLSTMRTTVGLRFLYGYMNYDKNR